MSWTLLLERLVPQASTYARDLDWLFEGIFWVVGFWFVLTVADVLLAAAGASASAQDTRRSTTTAASGS